VKRRRKVALAPEGARIIAANGLLVIIAAVVSMAAGGGRMLWLPAVVAIWFLVVVLFFRDHARVPPEGKRLILAPADGKVISIGEAIDSPLAPPGQRVSIFMSLLDIHVNRSPVTGKVLTVEHRRGRFHAAYKSSAARENEHTVITIETPFGEVALKQIAGVLTRRIVFHPQPGDTLYAADRVGMIRFGSRVDIFLPETAVLRVHLGDRVKAGETILGEFLNA